MPAIYAHRRFGESVAEQVREPERGLIERYRQLFDIGLHGPDILFYYRPVSSNLVNRTGNSMHTVPGKICFEQMWNVARAQRDPEPYLAYLYGFLCHYALDSACHGYINEMSRISGHSHGELEVELDRYFMIADGKDPMRYHPTGHIHPSERNAQVIAAFFPKITVGQVWESLVSMVMVERLWVASNPVKRGAVVAAAKALGKYDYVSSLLRPYEADPDCVGLLPPVISKYQDAISRAVESIQDIELWGEEIQAFPLYFVLPFDPQNAADAP